MFNDVDQYAGSLGQLYDGWVSALVGPHLSYLGLIDYLDLLEQTPFSQIVSVQTSGIFLKQIQDSGVTTRGMLLQHPIVIMSDFYRPFPLPNYTQTLFSQISDGVYIGNTSRLASLTNVTLPLYVIFGSHSGTWTAEKESWSQSVFAYEVNDALTPNVQATFPLAAPFSGNYDLGVRYWNGFGNGFSISVNDQVLTDIAYTNTSMPVLSKLPVSLLQGLNTVTITIHDKPSVIRYGSLDYLVLTGT